MKAGLFGGTFNPVHSGHVRVVSDILAFFPLNHIIVVPAGNPPHKQSDVIVDISHRLEMTRLAFKPLPQVIVSDVELNCNDRSYTIDTVNYFLATLSSETKLYLIMGLDAFLEIDKWKSYMCLMHKAPVIVIKRPLPDGRSGQDMVKMFLQMKVSDAYSFSSEQSCYFHPSLQPVYFHSSPEISISSSDIRTRLKNGRTVTGLIPDQVEKYIELKGLYQ